MSTKYSGVSGAGLRKTNFSMSGNEDDSQQKYVKSEDLEPVEKPESEFSKAFNVISS